jgi:DNA-binding response OmpR family regulator
MAAYHEDDFANSQGPQSGPASSPRILLADDDPEMRTLLAFALRSEGYEVVECADGSQLLEQLKAARAQSAPQRIGLVITDMRMPDIGGLEILGRLRDRPSVPPIILITAFGDEQTHTRARQLGAAASIDKPFEITYFLELVQGLLSHSPPPGGSGHGPAGPS